MRDYKREEELFCRGYLSAYLESLLRKVPTKVDSIPKDQFLATPEDKIVDHIYSELEVEPLTLREDAKEMEQEETQIDVTHDFFRNPSADGGPIYVSGVRVVVSIPYTGDSELWKWQPSRYQTVFPHACVRPPGTDGIGYLDIAVQQSTDEPPQKLKEHFDSEMKIIRFYVAGQRPQVEAFDASLRGEIREAIKKRKSSLKIQEGIPELLNIPLKKRGDAAQIKPIQVKRKLVKPLPPPPKEGFKPEPGIAEEDYEYILSIIRHEGRTFEATPKIYAVHDEEELRDILLAHLNGHYAGGATGETFRKSGKTDIRIKDQERAAFVAECKIWRGKKELLEAVDQLLGYLTWRDCKAAIVIFNKHIAKFTELLSKVPESVRTHSNMVKDFGETRTGEWKFLFRSLEDELRQIVVTVFVFNVEAD